MKATLFAVALPLLLAGCASQSPLPEVISARTPVNPGAKVSKTHYHTTLTGYTHRVPVTPDAWVPEDANPAQQGAEPVPEAPAAAADGQAGNDKCKDKEKKTDDCPVQ